MNKYYFIEDNEQKGPFSIDELKNKDLTPETLIWSYGFDNWSKIKDHTEIYNAIFQKNVPPPIPNNNYNLNNIENLNKRQRNKWLIGWIGFNTLALVLSYSEINLFNYNSHNYSSWKYDFWPFVEFISEEFDRTGHLGHYTKFNGIFFSYDMTEFLTYSCIGILFYFLFPISEKKPIYQTKKQSENSIYFTKSKEINNFKNKFK